MLDHIQIIARFKDQLMNPDLTEGERDALQHRITWLEMLHRPKPTYKPTNGTDILLEALKDPNYRCTPNSLLNN